MGWYDNPAFTGNAITQIPKGSIGNKTFYAKWVIEFTYTGSAQSFTAPFAGRYKIETWGAQGGDAISSNITYNGGYGGYSVGEITLNPNNILYIYVGGKGYSSTSQNVCGMGGYNGGGESKSTISQSLIMHAGSGGGATHISSTNTLLKDTSINNLIMASPGGGGGSYHQIHFGNNDISRCVESAGGNGGGYIGNDGSYGCSQSPVGWAYGKGGTQTNGGTLNQYNLSPMWSAAVNDGRFGIGGDGITNSGAGGGGGYYGGGGGHGGSAGGGSGYIGNASITNKHMTCYNCSTSNVENTKTISNTCVSENPTSDCSKTGNGYARITYLRS